MAYTYNKLRGRIIEKYGSLTAFCEHLTISMNSLSKKMTGKTRFSQEDIEKWAELLDIAPEEYASYFFA